MIIIDQALKTAIGILASNAELGDINNLCDVQQQRHNYVLKVLRLTSSIPYKSGDLWIQPDIKGGLIKQRAIRDAAAADSRGFPKLLAAILTLHMMPNFNRDQFIAAYERRANATVSALRYIAYQNSFSWKLPPPQPGPTHFAD